MCFPPPLKDLKWLLQLNLLTPGLISQHLTGRKSELKIPLHGRLSYAADMEQHAAPCRHLGLRAGGSGADGLSVSSSPILVHVHPVY